MQKSRRFFHKRLPFLISIILISLAFANWNQWLGKAHLALAVTPPTIPTIPTGPEPTPTPTPLPTPTPTPLPTATPTPTPTPTATPTPTPTPIPNNAPTITTTQLPNARWKKAYTASIQATDIDFDPGLTMTITNLPPGIVSGTCANLAGSPSTLQCPLSGKATVKGTFTVTSTVTDSFGAQGTRNLSLTVTN